MNRKALALLAACAIPLAGFSEGMVSDPISQPRPTVGALPVVDTNAVPTPVVTTPLAFGKQVWDTVFGQGLTNLAVTTFGTYSYNAKKWGAGLLVFRNIPLGDTGIATGLGMGVDYYASQFYAVSGQLGLKADMKPFGSLTNLVGNWLGNLVFTPHAFAGVEVPLAGGGNANGDLGTVAAAGANIKLLTIPGINVQLLLGGDYGTRTGIGEYSGPFVGGNLTFFKPL